jgi:arginyl-tRNA synthetase
VSENISAEELTKVYIKIREAKEAAAERHKQEISEFNQQLEAISAELLEICKELNVTSMRTGAGTVIRKVTTRFDTNDWGSMFQFIKDNDAFGLLQQRLHQNNMKQFLEENPELHPPGLWSDSQYTIVVRRS